MSTPNTSTESLDSVLQAALLRIASLEARLPEFRAGYGVLTTQEDGVKHHRVQTLDPYGKQITITFEEPIN